MKSRIMKFTLDCAKVGNQVCIDGIRQGDSNSLVFIISLKNGINLLDIVSGKEESVVITMYGKKADGTTIVRDCGINEDGNIIYTIHTQDTSCVGVVSYQLVITSTRDKILASPVFSTMVEERNLLKTYTVLTSEPEDWADNYDRYYYYADGRFYKLNKYERETAPEFVINTYYTVNNDEVESTSDFDALSYALLRAKQYSDNAEQYLEEVQKKADKEEVISAISDNELEIINTLPQFMALPIKVTARAICTDGVNLYHSGTSSYTSGGVKHMYATSKVNISTEISPTFVNKVGGHDKCYPRNMSIGNGYLFVPYRDTKSGELSSFDTNTDIGGYLDIIKLSDFTLAKSIIYSREPYVVTQTVNGVEKEVTKYFGKSHFTATYNDSLLCVTQQMGGWKLYDISTTPENPKLLYAYDNRADVYTDNADKKGYADFQQPSFFADKNGNVYLAISGYDRDLLMIYDLSDTTNPKEVFGYHCGENQLNLRTLAVDSSLTTPYLHTLGLACSYPYIYCTVAPHPNYLQDTTHAFSGVVVIDVSDISNCKTALYKIPNSDRATYSTGEPSPTTIAINSKHLVMDNADKGISVYSLINPAEPKYIGCVSTGTPVCGIYMSNDGRTFATSAVGSYGSLDSSITMYRGL